jgi:hypothetical protein
LIGLVRCGRSTFEDAGALARVAADAVDTQVRRPFGNGDQNPRNQKTSERVKYLDTRGGDIDETGCTTRRR